ncbi:nucleotide exchange factor GrpE [Aphanothece minutissima]|uniref:Protein GrpE n=1 Tax=Aphanothece cf. minutissima CCALA 015 TaxID=2107695 RepID=A0ABX5F5J5_9CHRO|nr:nucleotide exchange factor GrpE [Aphanothece minutissima]PSB36738.1 nucleotide exchange factor GrpE [Aphanothece cf. minutissima CCALA 015]
MTGDNTPPHEERIDPREGAVDAARVEELLETLPVNPDGGPDVTPPAEGTGAPDAAGAAPEAADSGTDRVSQLEAELAALRSENESLKGQYMRIAADFDNFRKRQSRDKEDQRLHITCTTLTEILPVVDNFDRARQQLNPQSEEAQSLHRSYQNLYKQLVDVFKQLGVSPMRVEGEPFDPSLHEAVLREPSEEHPEDVVIEELQRGYHLDGRVLRHALVKVSMGPGPAGGSRSDASAPPSEGTSD